jgi:hypothetical protein
MQLAVRNVKVTEGEVSAYRPTSISMHNVMDAKDRVAVSNLLLNGLETDAYATTGGDRGTVRNILMQQLLY